MSVLIINTGSSNSKFAIFSEECETPLISGSATANSPNAVTIEYLYDGNHHKFEVPSSSPGAQTPFTLVRVLAELQHTAFRKLGSIHIIGHRIVHGGSQFNSSVQIDEGVKRQISDIVELAPLHNSLAISAIEACEKYFPGCTQIAAFDTAFFANLPLAAKVYPLPYEWYAKFGIRRFGFHGLSHSYCLGRALSVLGRTSQDTRIVICHLGSGCSASAIKDGSPITTTMGFTPLAGLVMGTRPGDLDPGILIHLQNKHGLSLQEIEAALNHHSGLLGISGVSADFRIIEDRAAQGDERCRLAMDVFINDIRSTIGALAGLLGGIDVLVFTAGIGEHAAELRKTVCQELQFLGISVDNLKNSAVYGDTDISAADSHVRVLVVKTREDFVIYREALRIRSLCYSR